MSFIGTLTRRSNAPPADVLGKLGCTVCPLSKQSDVKVGLAPSGHAPGGIYILGEAPGSEENAQGVPFVGQSGQLMRQTVDSALQTSQLAEGARYNNVVRTHPPKNRNPTPVEIECCRPSVIADIEQTAPRGVIGVGGVPLSWAIQQTGILAWRGRRIPARFGKHRCWYYPTVHPAYVLRNGGMPGFAGRVFARDVANAVKDCSRAPSLPPEFDIQEFDAVYQSVRISTPAGEAEVRRILDAPIVAFDIETHSSEREKARALRPYGKGARILSIAFASNKGVVAALFDDPGKILQMLFESQALLVAHNIAFELEWLGVDRPADLVKRIDKWACTMAQAYVLDNRSGVLSLDNLCLQAFGVKMKALSSINIDRLIDESTADLLRYNALDAFFTHRLYEAQDARIRQRGMDDVCISQYRRVPATVVASIRGLQADAQTIKDHARRIEDSTSKSKRKIGAFAEVKAWERQHGVKFDSSKQDHLSQLLTHNMSIELSRTELGNVSSSAKSLEKVDHPLVKEILNLRSLGTLRGTFITPFEEGGKQIWEGDLLHPQFNTCRTATRRLSSSNPNGQNFPKRRDSWVREIIVAPRGYKIVSIDYAQMEARFIAADSQDKVLVDSILGGGDIHASWAQRIAAAYPTWELTDPGDRRNAAKGGLVFASFYRATPPTIARACKIPVELAHRLLEEFWREFTGVNDWHADLVGGYERDGFIELSGGFRCHGILTLYQIVNYRVQGSASDIVVDAMSRLAERALVTDTPQLQPILNIHDDLTFYLPEATMERDIETIAAEMLVKQECMQQIPLAVEVSAGDDWGRMSEVKTFEA